MSLINLLPQKIIEELRSKSLLKVISGLNNFDASKLFNPEITLSKDLLLNSSMIFCGKRLIRLIYLMNLLPDCDIVLVKQCIF